MALTQISTDGIKQTALNAEAGLVKYLRTGVGTYSIFTPDGTIVSTSNISATFGQSGTTITITKAAHGYPVGSFVDVRNTCGDYRVKHALSGQPAIVLSTNETVVSAAKGAKRYKVLPIGSSKPIYAEERWLKKVKKS